MAATLLEQFRENVEPGKFYDDGTMVPPLPETRPVRLIAFYLPQFHAIPENDEWWGTGFTEWTNVTRALPRFPGHYQPRLPGALGFYDLSRPDILRRQAQTAQRYGIEGFCFHYYWFAGRKLLQRPLENLTADPSIDLPFCINWANESWSRRWDGSETSVLIAQDHSPEDDLAFARAIEPLFDDPRYIRIDGRPLLMLYRPSLLPDARATVERWREYFGRSGIDLYVTMAQSFDHDDPRPYGMDAAAGFPPHRSRQFLQPIATGTPFDSGFRSEVLSYDEMAAVTAAYRPTEFRLLPGVCPSWDNEARSPGRGLTITGSTPASYGRWLEAAARWISEVAPPDERIVFINAWNEWAEGTYLEPDRHFGFGYLAETARTLGRLEQPGSPQLEPLPTPRPAARAFIRRAARAGARVAERCATILRSI